MQCRLVWEEVQVHPMPLDAACAERCFLYRSIWYMTVEIIDGFVVPTMLVLRVRHLHHN